MSLNFSQIVDLIRDITDSDENTYSTSDITRDVNLALDEAYSTIFQVGGTWQFDDSNHTDYPIITTNIVSGQRDYSFVSDENGNLILDVQKVFLADENGNYREITPVDVPSGAPFGYTDGQNTTGLPNTYEKNATGIFLDPIPNYNYADGLKVYISREGSYFSTSDTTKKPGFAGLYHEFIALRPAYHYCLRNGMKKASNLKVELNEMKNSIMEYYKRREKDVVKTLRAVATHSR